MLQWLQQVNNTSKQKGVDKLTWTQVNKDSDIVEEYLMLRKYVEKLPKLITFKE